MAADPRHIVGSMVEAKACHVMNLVECSCRYGSNSKTKRVQGIVTHVEVIKNSTTNRTMTFVMAAYDLGGHDDSSLQVKHPISQGSADSYSSNRHYSWWHIAGGNRQIFDDDRSFDTTNSHRTTLEAPLNSNTSSEEPTVAVLRETPPLTTENNNNIISNNDTPLPEVAATVHDQEWFVDDPATKLPVNGNYHSRNWAVKTRMGYMLG